MAITKLQSESLNLADDYTFTGTVAGAGESNVPAFMVYRSGSAQNVSNATNTKVQYNAELFDTNNCYDNTTNFRFTPTTAGKYYIFHNVGYGRDTSNVWYAGYVYIYKNGINVAVQQISTSSNQNYWTQTVSTIVDMNGTTYYVEAFVKIGVDAGITRINEDIHVNQFGGFLLTT